MWYVINCRDMANSAALRTASRPAHLLRLQALRDRGKLLLAGPYPAIDSTDPGEHGFTGSLIIAEFNSLEDAERWASHSRLQGSRLVAPRERLRLLEHRRDTGGQPTRGRDGLLRRHD